jgi:hypothetical protein
MRAKQKNVRESTERRYPNGHWQLERARELHRPLSAASLNRPRRGARGTVALGTGTPGPHWQAAQLLRPHHPPGPGAASVSVNGPLASFTPRESESDSEP